MQIKTVDGDREVASKGVAGTALGLGIAGTVGLLNQFAGGCGWGGGFLGGNRAGYCPMTHDAATSVDTREIGRLESKIAKLESERYTDGVGLELYREIISQSNKNDEKIQANYVELAKALAALDKQVAVDKQATVDNFAFLNNEICNTKKEIMCYVNATFVPGKLVMPLSNICPEAMQRYNSWIAPTTTAEAGA
jgi:hypothetical protein